MLIVIMLIFGVACALIANSKGRIAVAWFFIGFFATWIGLILILVLSSPRERERVDNAARADRRRLREQLRQERMKNEAYRRHAASRLDLHDRALGMDTRQSSALPAGHGLQQPLLEGHVAESGTLKQAPGMLSDESFRPPEAGDSEAGSPEAGNPEAGVVAPPPIVNAPAEWHYERRGQSQGPVTARAVRALVSQGRLEGTSLVWREGMADWRPVSEVPQFRASFEG